LLLKLSFILLLCCMILFGVSCNEKDINEEISVMSALKISTWVLDAQLSGTGYWTYDENFTDYGYWVSNDGTHEYDSNTVFVYEQLELNDVRVLAPLSYEGRPNLNIYIEFDGIVEVETENPNDTSLRLAHSLDYPDDPRDGNWTVENGFRTRAPFMLNVCPIGKFTAVEQVVTRDTLTDREYYIYIKTYEEDGTLLITATLKLIVLNDDAYPYDQFSSWVWSPNEERSRFLSIELVSYEYSDIYKFDEEMVVTE